MNDLKATLARIRDEAARNGEACAHTRLTDLLENWPTQTDDGAGTPPDLRAPDAANAIPAPSSPTHGLDRERVAKVLEDELGSILRDGDDPDYPWDGWSVVADAVLAITVDLREAKADCECGATAAAYHSAWLRADQRVNKTWLAWASARRRAKKAERRIQKVRDLHSPMRIYDECSHAHDVNDDGGLPDGVRLVENVGLVCEDGFMYEICRECCTDGGEYQTEQCAEHPHEGPAACYPCPTRAILDGAS